MTSLVYLSAWRRRFVRSLISTILFVIGVSFAPYLWCSRQADAWFRGDAELHEQLARGVETWITTGLSPSDFNTGSAQFDGEWLFGTYMMAAMGFGQTALQHLHLREKHIQLMQICIERLLSDEVKAFDRDAWGNDPIETLGADSDHAAYLGYLNLVLSLHRLLDPQSEYAELNDRITDSLVRRIQASPIRLIQSYPFEVYPVDNCCVVGSIGLHARATGIDRSAFLEEWDRMCRERYVDRQTGLLYQCVHPRTGKPMDYARGSGTALGLYALSFCNALLSKDFYNSSSRHLAGKVFGFGGVREYPRDVSGETGDIDSGPVVLGFGLSSTGFLIAGTRIHGDQAFFSTLYATAYAWGAPYVKNDRMNFVTGGSLGDAILFAMLTALPSEEFKQLAQPAVAPNAIESLSGSQP